MLNNELEIGEIQLDIRNIYYGSKKMTKDMALKECKLMINSYRPGGWVTVKTAK